MQIDQPFFKAWSESPGSFSASDGGDDGPSEGKLKFRTVWISDVHLGTPGCQAQARTIRQRNDGLDGSFSERFCSEDDRAFIVLESAGKDLASRSASLVDQDDHRVTRQCAPSRIEGAGLLGASMRRDDRPARHEDAGDQHRLGDANDEKLFAVHGPVLCPPRRR